MKEKLLNYKEEICRKFGKSHKDYIKAKQYLEVKGNDKRNI